MRMIHGSPVGVPWDSVRNFRSNCHQKITQVAEGRMGDLQKDDSGTPAGDLTEIRRRPKKGKLPDGLHKFTRGSPTVVPSEIAGSPLLRINISCDFQLQERDLCYVMKTRMG